MAHKKHTNERPPHYFMPENYLRQKIWRVVIHLFVWIGIAVLYYIGFSIFFDTPLEARMKHSTAELQTQYDLIDARLDSLDMVLGNVVDRDRNVFKILFEAEPYDFDDEFEATRWMSYENLLAKSNKELDAELTKMIVAVEAKTTALSTSYDAIAKKAEESGDAVNYIPAIQPVVNNELTLLTASYGLRIHPFYKSLVSHQGVDYTVPEGSRVFATADGKVKDVSSNKSSSGLVVIISHGNGYETQYSHLYKSNVKVGQEVKRGDIIALSGNSGLSLAPHLHYEIKHNGLRVDPIHYFFLELSPTEYRRIQRIARSGMQSFD
jgi:hypothetical protein